MYIEKAITMLDAILLNPYVQEYAGANYTCSFCGNLRGREHDGACESREYLLIREKMLREHVAIEEAVDASLSCLFHGRKPTKEEFSRAAKAFRDLELAQTPPAGSP